MNMKMVKLSVNEALANTNSKSIVLTSGKNPEAKEVKWSVSVAVRSLVVFTTFKKNKIE